MRITSSLAALVMLLSSLAFAAEAPAKKPNVLFIAVDDLRPELGCYGGVAKSPNLDGLASRGLVFDRAYCQQAVCSPSRTSLLTGRRPDTTKIYDLETHFRDTIPDVITLPQHFMNNGYHAQGFGKIYHGGLNDEKSWSVPHQAGRMPAYGNPESLRAQEQDRKRVRERGGDGAKAKGPAWEIAEVQDSKLPDGNIADLAIEAMRQVKDKPFFLAVGFLKPHLPFVAPKRFFDMYPPESIELSKNPNRPSDVPAIAMTNSAELRGYSDMPKGDEPFSEQQARDLRRAYYASTSFMDAQVGRVLKELDALGLRENTIIIVWGDHGWHLGDQGLWCKHTNFEVAARAPLIISVPGMKSAGSKTAALTEFVDIYPTLCELAGLPLPDGLEGSSFVPLLEDPSRFFKLAAFSQYPRQKDVMGYSMKTGQYRYTEWVKRDDHTNVVARELYDHRDDPMESANIVEHPRRKNLVKTLSEQLRAGWQAAGPRQN